MAESGTSILIGGEAGQGLATIGRLMVMALARTGYDVHVTQSYMSRIRGGHNTFAIRTGSGAAMAPTEQVDILVALNRETLDLHIPELGPRGLVVVDESLAVDLAESLAEVRAEVLGAPFGALAPKPVLANVAALGVLGSAICGDLTVLEGLVSEAFARKGPEVVGENLAVLRAAFEWVKGRDLALACMPPPPKRAGKRIVLTGNEAVALGALAAGCGFCSFYPMTPSTSVALTLIDKGRGSGLVVEQAEDEIAAANMAVGASFAGARCLVPTSGGGFALMTEAVSLAGMLEVPLVFVLAQRPGPATGLPTRTEQADLDMVLSAGHGEFPRAVFAPGTVEECFYLTHRAFDLAARWQSPAFVLTDQYLADCYRAVEPFDLDVLPEVPGPMLDPPDPGSYRRYAPAPDGVSPWVAPGLGRALVRSDSDEHSPDGRLTEDLKVRVEMVEKRLAKGLGIMAETLPPVLYGLEAPDALLVCWGSTLSAVLEASEALVERGVRSAVLHFAQLWPLKEDQFMPLIESARSVVCVEGNATGQLARLLRRETGFEVHGRVLRFDGLPMTAAYVLRGLESIL
ncbi:MAG: 2-oxoacid:acceptor oxidoreductase subunit alpha [Desulfovibrionaceae bacterium]|nr:2-oxoacid:acceptor oxidoreductase subunit alpha [Desulfovibrionaceae bacterium]